MFSFIFGRDRRGDPPNNRPTFEVVFPSYDIVKGSLENWGVDIKWFTEVQYTKVKAIIGSTQLRQKTGDQNKILLARIIESEYPRYERYKKLYDLETEAILRATSSNTQKVYNVDSVEGGQVSADYLAGASTATNESNIPVVDRIDTLNEISGWLNPEVKYIQEICKWLSFPLSKRKGPL